MLCWLTRVFGFATALSLSHAAATTGNDSAFRPLSPESARTLGVVPDRAWTSDATPGLTGRLAVALPQVEEKLTLLLTGAITSSSALALRSVDGRRELKLSLRAAPGGHWCDYTWTMPPEWRGQPAVLIVEDDSAEGSMGIALPAGPGAGSNSWFALGATAFAAVLTILPFITAFELLRRRHGADRALHLALALVGSGLFAVATFFAFFLARGLGIGVLLCGAAAGVYALGRAARDRERSTIRILLAGVGATVAIAAVLFLYGGTQSAGGVPAGRYDLGLPPDNHIPEMFADKIYSGAPLRPFLADWLTSDRPPLQTGVLLWSRPLLAGSPGRIAAAIAAQLAVLAGLFAVLEALRLPRRTALAVVGLCATSGFFILNALYAWPKLLPAAYLLAAAGLLLRLGRSRKATPLEALAIGACAALAMLGHGGSFFALAGLGIVHVLFRAGWRDARLLVIGGTAAAIVYAPWTTYQKLADPPGDRLLKYHLAGRTAIDPRDSLTVIAEAYAQTSLDQIVRKKGSNLRVLVGDFSNLPSNLATAAREAGAGDLRAAYWRFVNAVQGGAFFHLLQSLGVLAAGVPFLWLARRSAPTFATAGRYCLVASFATIAVWCLLMFGPEGCVVHQGSYFVNALLHVAGALGLLALPPVARGLLMGLHLCLTTAVWVLSPTWNPWQQALRPSLDGFWATVLLAGLAALAWLAWLAWRDSAMAAGGNRVAS